MSLILGLFAVKNALLLDNGEDDLDADAELEFLASSAFGITVLLDKIGVVITEDDDEQLMRFSAVLICFVFKESLLLFGKE